MIVVKQRSILKPCPYEQEFEQLHLDVGSVSHQAAAEKAEVDLELHRLSQCVLSFQQRISQVHEWGGACLVPSTSSHSRDSQI